MKKAIVTRNAPASFGPYSQAIQQGPFLFCSGQVAIDPATEQVLKVDVEQQAAQIMKNIDAILKEADYAFSDVVKATIFLTSMDDFARVNQVYGSYFKEAPPARSTVAVSGLPKGVQVEIEVIAYKG